MIGYFLAWFSFFPFIRKQIAIRERDGPEALAPEARLYWLLYLAPLEPIGLFGFAWTSQGPPTTHWIAPLLFSSLIGIANVCLPDQLQSWTYINMPHSMESTWLLLTT